MERVFLVRVPFFPQFNVLKDLHELAPQVVSLLTFWMTENREPSYCEVRHNYQIARHLCVELNDYVACLQILKDTGLFDTHEIETRKADPEKEISRKTEVRLTLKVRRLQELLNERGFKVPLSLLLNSANDSFDFYDVIEDKHLPIEQKLYGTISGKTYEDASFISALYLLYLDSEHQQLSLDAIAEAWRILLPLPEDTSLIDYAKELNERFLRKGERAIDVNLSDGNIFIPDHDEIKNLVHITRHYRKKELPMLVASSFFMMLSALFKDNLKFSSDLGLKELTKAVVLTKQFLNWAKINAKDLGLENYTFSEYLNEDALNHVFTDTYFDNLELTIEERAQFLQDLSAIK